MRHLLKARRECANVEWEGFPEAAGWKRGLTKRPVGVFQEAQEVMAPEPSLALWLTNHLTVNYYAGCYLCL